MYNKSLKLPIKNIKQRHMYKKKYKTSFPKLRTNLFTQQIHKY